MQAAPILGLFAEARFDPAGDGRVVIDLRAGETLTTPIAAAIPKRQCTRGLYDGRAVPVPDVRTLAGVGSSEGIDLVFLTGRSAIDALGALVIDGNTMQMGDPAPLSVS